MFIYGLVQLGVTYAALMFFLYILGTCTNGEKYALHPKMVKLNYPKSERNDWVHFCVSETAIKYGWYVTSISQFCGCRGSSANKILMVITCFVASSQLHSAIFLYKTGEFTISILTMACVSSFALFTLGFCESAILWDIPPMSRFHCVEDEEIVRKYNQSKGNIDTTAGEDIKFKRTLSIIHSICAIIFIFLQFAIAQEYWELNKSAQAPYIVACIGMGAFVLFALMQYFSGANDSFLGCLAIKNFPKLQFFYYPQGSVSERKLNVLSTLFLTVEFISFISMSTIIAVIAVTL